MANGTIAMILIGVLIYIVFAAGIYLFSGLFTTTAIASFIFTTLAFILAFATPRVAANKPDVEAVFFGIPMMGFAAYYFLAQVFVGIVFIAFQQFVPFEIAFFLQLVLLVAFIVICVVSFTAQRASSNLRDERREQAAARDLRTVDIQSVLDCARTAGMAADTLRALEHLSETVRYSDPFGADHPAIQEIEVRIADKVMGLQGACDANDDQRAQVLARELENLYAERSRKLLLVK